jgi:hypothetical protein
MWSNQAPSNRTDGRRSLAAVAFSTVPAGHPTFQDVSVSFHAEQWGAFGNASFLLHWRLLQHRPAGPDFGLTG